MKSEAGRTLFTALQEQVRTCLKAVDALDFDRCKAIVEEARAIVTAHQKAQASADEDTLNDLTILGYFVGFLFDYANFWERVVKKEYEPSWNALQDTLDSLRLLKKLSSIDLARFENQLVDLEKTYPYKLFASIGGIARLVECSICGKDIDSFDCTHRAGQLYMGKLAQGIVRDFKQLDHVALTENPEDKRCVMKLQGRDYEYPAIDWLAANLSARTFVVSAFSHVEMSERRRRNVRLGRNDPCFCGSGKKFKHCCVEKEFSTYPHAKFILRGSNSPRPSKLGPTRPTGR